MKKRTGLMIFMATAVALVGGFTIMNNNNNQAQVEGLAPVEVDYVSKVTNIYNKLSDTLKNNSNYRLNNMYDLESMNGFAYIYDNVVKNSVYAMSYNVNVYNDEVVDTSNYIEYVIDMDKIKDKSFKIEDTAINDITKLFIEEGIDYSKINNDLISAFNGETFDIFIDEVKVGNFTQTLLISQADDENGNPYYRLIVENVLENK